MDAGLRALVVGLFGASLCGCASLGYYAHLARGQMELLSKREAIEKIVEDPARDAELRRRLALVLDARRFAVDKLGLPDNASYTLYADLGRPYVVWNVFATPEFSLEPIESCFPLTGCLAYRGHYRKELAQEQVEKMKAKGYDVEIGGVPAYSTLGWFDDPVLSTMMRWSDAVLVGTVFHELGHQRLYVKNDTTFNESYASFIEQQGLSDFLREHPQTRQADSSAFGRRTQFVRLILAARQRLEDLYTSPLPDAEKRQRKTREFARLQAEYTRLRDEAWGGDTSYDDWFSKAPLNNARLLPFGLYDEDVPAFAALFEQNGRDWMRFHAAAKALAKLDEPERRTRLDSLARRRRPE